MLLVRRCAQVVQSVPYRRSISSSSWTANSAVGSNDAHWLGKQLVSHDVLSLNRVRCISALYPVLQVPSSSSSSSSASLSSSRVQEGDELPPCWHWCFFPSPVPRADIGADGHEKLGVFLPQLEPKFVHRMWAGGEIRFLRPLRVGSSVKKISTVKSITRKTGKTSGLVFVSVQHEIFQWSAEGAHPVLAIDERQDIVYKTAATAAGTADAHQHQPPPPPSSPASSTSEAKEPSLTSSITPADLTFSFGLKSDPVLLFRYSALTYNSHRIHYDIDYCRQVEGYPDLVVHGPLLATLLGTTAHRQAQALIAAHHTTSDNAAASLYPSVFSYRAISPVFANSLALFDGKITKGTTGECAYKAELGVNQGASMTATFAFHKPELLKSQPH